MTVRLYHYWRSSSSWRVRWALAIKGIPCEFVPVNLLTEEPNSPEHLKRNPLGYVPVLEVTTPSTPFRFLAESSAIIEWLEETYPQPSLFSGDSFQRARIRQLAQIVNSDIQPLQNPNVALFHSELPQEQKKWNQQWILNGLRAYEVLVSETAKQFSVGNSITCADLFLVPQCYNALRNEIALDQFPNIHRIYQASLQTPSCQDSAPERFEPKN